jgi:putative hydrolase of the HAD superfamily
MIKVIAFDIGGVFLDSERTLGGICEEFARIVGVPPEKVVKLYDQYLNRMLVGKVSASGFFALIKKKFDAKGDLKNVWLRVAMSRLTLNDELLKVVDKLRIQYRVVVLSDVSQTQSFVEEELGLYSHFDRAFLSYKLKMRKPSKQAFASLLKGLKAHPDEVLFVDDKESNLRVAREMGIKSIQFNNNAQLLTEFARLGLV